MSNSLPLKTRYTLSLFSAEQWHELPNFPNPNKWGYSMVSLNNDVYVTGKPILMQPFESHKCYK